MKNNLTPLLPLVALLATASTVQARQADTRTLDQKVMDTITAELRRTVGENPKRVGKVGSSTLILYRPGIMISIPEDKKDVPGYVEEYFSVICNSLPAASLFFEATSQNLEDVWAAILGMKVTPQSDPSPEEEMERVRLEKWLAVVPDPNKKTGLGEPESRFDRYMRYLAAKDDAFLTLENERDSALKNKTRLNPKFAREVLSTKSQLESTSGGDMFEVVKAKEKMDELLGKDPAYFFGKLREGWDSTFAVTGNTGKIVHKLVLLPPMSEWEKGGGWSKVNLSSSDFASSDVKTSVTMKMSAQKVFGLFSLGGGGSASKQTRDYNEQSSSYGITAEVKRVMIYRPWLNSIVFTGGFWGFGAPGETEAQILGANPTAKNYLNISSGLGITDSTVRPTELMPLLPTELLLARNVVITAKFSSDFVSTMKKTIEGGGSIGFGPFTSGSVSASSSKDVEEKKKSVSEGGLSFADTQVIGVYGAVMGQIPNPDPLIFKNKPIVRPDLKKK
nr:hypothetical protein [Armatimonas sp.]